MTPTSPPIPSSARPCRTERGFDEPTPTHPPPKGQGERMTPLQRAYHHSTTPEVLATLAGDADGDIRWSVAEHPSTPVEVLAELAGEDRESTRLNSSHHQNSY